MLAIFNLKNQPLGVYDLVVETHGVNTIELPAYFTVMPGERSETGVNSLSQQYPLMDCGITITIP